MDAQSLDKECGNFDHHTHSDSEDVVVKTTVESVEVEESTSCWKRHNSIALKGKLKQCKTELSETKEKLNKTTQKLVARKGSQILGQNTKRGA